MKIAAILDGNVETGGGFNQSLNAVLQMRDITKGEFDFVVITSLHANIGFRYRAKCCGISAKIFFTSRLPFLPGTILVAQKSYSYIRGVDAW